jgi:4-hydroxyphenylacetate 3-hydroxylase-like protein
VRAAFETNWSVHGQSATARMKFRQFAWDLLGSDCTGQHTQYETFYAVPQFVNVAYSFLHSSWTEMRELVEDHAQHIPLLSHWDKTLENFSLSLAAPQPWLRVREVTALSGSSHHHDTERPSPVTGSHGSVSTICSCRRR